jgi:hypothetical protein
VYRYDARGERQHFYTFGPGSFLGELAQLGGRPSFGDGHRPRTCQGAELSARPHAGFAGGVSRAFLCTFIRSSQESLKHRTSSFLGQNRMNNLMKTHN